MSDNRVFTSTEAAKYCGVSFRTIIRWIEKGRLDAFQLPGRGDNRIPLKSLVKFMEENNIPVPEELQASSAKRVLVVEDQPEMASAIKRVLHRAGYEVTIALDGFSAGAKLQELKPVLVTLDLKMPGMDGFKVLDFIRNESRVPEIKVLVISAELEENLKKSQRMGADEVLPKPFESSELLAKVKKLLG